MGLLKRLDDSNDEVRVAVCLAISEFFMSPDESFWQGTPFKYSLESLFLHLDDQDVKIQENVYKCLVKAGEINNDLLEQMARKRLVHQSNSKILHLLISQN